MAKKFLGQIDLNKIPVKNLVAENASSAPSNPVEGQVYQNTTDHKMYRWNGTSWLECSAPASIDASSIANGSVSNTEFQYLDGVTGAIQTQLGNKAGKYSTNIGDSTNVTFTVTHNLGTKDCHVTIRQNSDDAEVDGVQVVYATTNTVVLTFEAIVATDALRVVVHG